MSDESSLRAKVLASPRLHLVDHPMVQHKLAILRDRETSSKQFRELVREVALFEGYEATRDFPLRPVEVQTPVAEATCQIVDPMLATGGSLEAAVQYLREAGVKDIRVLCVLAAPEGIARVLDCDPDVQIYAGAVDEGLNESAYIVPGLGDAGDRIFGTV